MKTFLEDLTNGEKLDETKLLRFAASIGKEWPESEALIKTLWISRQEILKNREQLWIFLNSINKISNYNFK